ncbi:MAG: hypothetical protein QOI58_4302 [Thermoanaerobaculia bacterium]|jgi:hypothetical protein|nr:hypothetical protein [Thermoanaerobaculia bacterium]
MAHWLTKIVVGNGNVIRERSLTNWNTFDASEIVAEKAKEKASLKRTSADRAAESNEGGNTERD